ncbi:dihydrodipicolinate synthase family protein [Gracilibacillus sp. S3-1-1]|uniref:Dihydrodipicolinate synthase family protein n=1 Tax=Gracilibacillus pellucidus TaxID=3095368 RepID=A0ACC6M0T7_9BACI|nr:dihydrodipicolinate synthase family protein [Gracilibacillus sp. S3-1-1]MDX8044546.1 dihydrodipicolinate synthase family protein [Gracilibacillus sp. S3-1-1]
MSKLILPNNDRVLYTYEASPYTSFDIPTDKPFEKRIAFSAAHVVADPLADADPTLDARIDWDKTMEYRHYLWSLGLSVAEAMDTAQRGMGLSWEGAKELISRSIKEAKSVGGNMASGVGTDHLSPSPSVTLEQVEKAYEEQVSFVEAEGGKVILMASRALAACAKGPEDYQRVYNKILQGVSEPVILHWLGDMFDPALKGYWGYEDVDKAMEVCLQIIRDNEAKVDGIKISLLDDHKEITMRRKLPESVNMYTGDDFNYPNLIKGDEQGYSHALLGIFDAIAPAAAAAMHALDAGDLAKYDQLLEKTVPLSRHIFQTPTFSYKTGIVFMAYLNGHQDHFRMIGGKESARSIVHLADLFVMADEAGLLRDPALATERMRLTLELAGVKQEGVR